MSGKPLISVIIPVYKVEKYLDKCIMSVVNQTYSNLEIILVDDGSPDNCPKMCDDWAERDSRIRVIHKENGGQASAKNAGIDIMRGELVGFIDSDDYIAPEMFERLYEVLTENDADLSNCDILSIRDNGDGSISQEIYFEPFSDQVLSREQALTELANDNLGKLNILVSKLYKSSIFKTLRFTVGVNHEDDLIIHRILGECKRIAITSEAMYFYVRRKDSTMGEIQQHNFHLGSFKGLRDAFIDRYHYLNDLGMPETAEFVIPKIYALLITNLRKVNYIKYRYEMNKALPEVLRALIMSKSLRNKYRACKLCLMCLLSMFK
ncbi:MAG: glycosyltransferase [Synergistaceae bacterium]|nr:glycosyltransferase [Synergistaceae bacterium]